MREMGWPWPIRSSRTIIRVRWRRFRVRRREWRNFAGYLHDGGEAGGVYGFATVGRPEAKGEAGRRTRGLIKGVVSGISHYGNCVGVPTVGGELVFDAAYEGNRW